MYNQGIRRCSARLTSPGTEVPGMPRRPTIPRINFADAMPFKIDGVYCKLIHLSMGEFAIVDAEDHARIAHLPWHAKRFKKAKTLYAAINGEEIKDGRKRRFTILLHRFLQNVSDRELCDHRNRLGLDCRRKNLRVCEKWANNSNQDLRQDSTTGFKGVHFHSRTNKFVARVQHRGVRHSAGYFSNPIDAAKAYDNLATHLHGEFAKLNFPKGSFNATTSSPR